MIKVKVSNNFPDWQLERQIPTDLEGYEFYVNQDIDECDYWVVYEGLMGEEKVVCPKENIIFISAEPPIIRSYNQTFLDQFATVITCQQDMKHKNKVITQQGLPWHIGKQQNYEFFKNANPEKTKLISVICSNKVFTEDHKRRYDFVMALKKYFGDRLDVFGHGINDIADKWDAIADYKYHVVLENNPYKDYWTEKLADCYLAGAYPLYYGCPNISDYFDEDAYTAIDITDHEEAIKTIEMAIASEKYENSQQELQTAKDLVLDKYNVFALIAGFCKDHSYEKQLNTLYPDGSRKLKKLKPLSRKIQDEIGRFFKRHAKVEQPKREFKEAIGFTYWGDVWKNYYIGHKAEIPKKLQVLKTNLDPGSQELVDLVFDRYVFQTPWQKYQENFLFDNDAFFTEQELQEQQLSLDVATLEEKYRLPTSLYQHSVFMYDNGLKLLNKWVLKSIKGKDFIDGGAFSGESALVFGQYEPNKVYSFEPCFQNYCLLQKTIEMNQANDYIVPVNQGLGDKKQEKEIYVYGDKTANSMHNLENFNSTAEKISITTIDDFVKENNLTPGLIKLDVEGYELETIKGALNAIKEHKPVLLISVYHHPKDFFEIKPLIENLNLGYKFMFRKLYAHNIVTETTLIGYVDA